MHLTLIDMEDNAMDNLIDEVQTIKEQLNGLDSVVDRMDSITRLLEYMIKEQEKTNEWLKANSQSLEFIESGINNLG